MHTLNLDRLHEASLGDDEFASELAELFLDDAALQLQSLHSAVESHDAARVSQIAHRLKGSCGNIGAERLSRLSEALEKEGRSGWNDDFPARAGAINTEFALLRSELERAVGSKG